MTINPTLLELVAQERRQEDLAGLERRQLLRLLAAQPDDRRAGAGLAYRRLVDPGGPATESEISDGLIRWLPATWTDRLMSVFSVQYSVFSVQYSVFSIQ